MRRLLCMAVVLFGALPSSAADNAKPNTLTPKEIEDGWILLFDGETTFGWKVEGDVAIKEKAMIIGGPKRSRAITTTSFSDFQFALEASWDDGKEWLFANGRLEDNWSTITGIQKELGKFRSLLDFRRPDRRLSLTVEAGKRVWVRNLKLKPLGLKSIFNGKDLTGWKEFKGQRYKSQFSVTKEGWLHIKSGPGDIQTKDQWGDFVLQIDCLTNGDYLNSGVFFRCQPDKYQQGYEAQIHNKFLPPPGRDYTIEEYDPKTHKLIDKKKIKNQAADYGTGAIYRRVPARKQMAKDREWFTMTVAAEGRHIAVWVNGYQVTDWTDNRPLADNARNGCRLEAGPISLQGHDPTTDLSFRNIRIAELPKTAQANKKEGRK